MEDPVGDSMELPPSTSGELTELLRSLKYEVAIFY